MIEKIIDRLILMAFAVVFAGCAALLFLFSIAMINLACDMKYLCLPEIIEIFLCVAAEILLLVFLWEVIKAMFIHKKPYSIFSGEEKIVGTIFGMPLFK